MSKPISRDLARSDAGDHVAQVSPFEALGANLRFGTTENGTPFVVAADFARAMGYSRTSDAVGLLDEDEKGAAIIRTPGGDQRVSVLYEDGIWELIFRSSKQEAKALKKRVKEILAEIRRTGRYEAEPVVPDITTPAGVLAMAEQYVDVARRLVVSERRRVVAEEERDQLAPAAESWEALVEAGDDYALREAAQILSREPTIMIGQNQLSRLLRELGWCDRKSMPYQSQVNTGRLVARLREWTDRDTGEARTSYQVRITPKGMHDLRGHLLGVKPLGRQLKLADMPEGA